MKESCAETESSDLPSDSRRLTQTLHCNTPKNNTKRHVPKQEYELP